MQSVSNGESARISYSIISFVKPTDHRLINISTVFHTSSKLSTLETICMTCHNLFSRTIKKNILILCLLKILPRVLRVNL